MLNAFTIDVEDYFHVSAFAERIPIRDWDRQEQRVEIGMQRLFSLLDRFQVRATCFVLGWIAERHPRLVRQIQAAGHEIACHSHHHQLVYNLSPDEFRTDLRRAKGALEHIAGEPVVGYRAPSFSVVRRSLWALDILAEEGMQYDSSIYPIRHDRYGIPDGRVGPHPLELSHAGRTLWEFPGTVGMLGGRRVPVGGGGYFRLYPYRVSAALLKRVNQQAKLPFMFYVHPWELDPDQPHLPGSWLRRWRHRVNLATTERRIERLLTDFSFGAMSDVLQEYALEHPADGAAVDPDGGRLDVAGISVAARHAPAP